LTNRADVKALSIYDETPLQVAAACGKADLAELLLAAGANPNARADANSFTPLHFAAEDGSRDVVERLLAHGADPNSTAVAGQRGVTPLMLAATYGHDTTAELLLQHKAEPNPKDASGRTALFRAVEAKHVAVVKTLLVHGADPDTKRSDGFPVLFIAVGQDSPEMTSALIEAKADVNELVGQDRWTALHYAAKEGVTAIAKQLLAVKADMNARDAQGDTPLHFAVRYGKDDIVALLLAAKADPNVRNHDGRTALDLAKGAEGNNVFGIGMPGGTLTLSGRQGGIPEPKGVVLTSTPPASKPAEKSMADVLREHGALDVLPDWDRIRVSRPSANFTDTVFRRSTNDWNRFSLLELVFKMYPNGNESMFGDAVAFPDLTRIVIVRPATNGVASKRIDVNLLNATNDVEFSRDVPLEFGDVVEIPEREHSLAAGKSFLSDKQSWDVLNFLRSQAGEFSLVVGSAPPVKVPLQPGFVEMDRVLAYYNVRPALTSNSDLTRVRVTRRDPKTQKTMVWILDCQSAVTGNNYNSRFDLWVRAGDVIEVPAKP
jgi:ankyrin repeat protein